MLNVLTLRPILVGMAKPPEPPQPTRWSIYKVAAKATWLGTVEAPDAATAIEKAAAEFNVDTWRLLAVAPTTPDSPQIQRPSPHRGP
jgi:hypothetical protein